jgi:adenosylcobinamide-phosphate synthase
MLIFSGADPLAVLLFAFVLDLAFGDMATVFRYVPHPVALAGKAVTILDKRLNRMARSDGERRRRGVMTVLLLTVIAGAVGWIIKEYLGIVHYGWALEALLVAILLAQRSLFESVAAVGHMLQKSGLPAGRAAVAKITDRDTEALDQHAVLRAAIESLFWNFSTGLVAPAFWFVLFDLPGLFVYKTVLAAGRMIGHRSPRYLHFGWAAMRLNETLDWIPARLTGLLICVAALVAPGAKAFAGLRAMIADAGQHRLPNTGWPEAAAAGALGIALGGSCRYDGVLVDAPWLGRGRARVTLADLAAALKLCLAASVCLVAMLLAGIAARQFS